MNLIRIPGLGGTKCSLFVEINQSHFVPGIMKLREKCQIIIFLRNNIKYYLKSVVYDQK